MTQKFERLFQVGRIGTMKLRNRLVRPPLYVHLGSPSGEVTQRMIEYYAELAKGGVGLVMTEIICIDYPVGKAGGNQVRIDDDSVIAGHSELVEAVHDQGAKIGIQLHHGGRQANPLVTGGVHIVAPSPIPCEFISQIAPPELATPRELTTEEVEQLVQKFVAAAVRAKSAGYDTVQIHGAHGYLVTEFMSPRMNKRTDKYGGDINGRMTFPLEIVKGVRAAVGPDYPIIFRTCSDEFVEGGITLEEGKAMAKMLEEAGVDALDVSVGVYATLPLVFDTTEKEEGWRAYISAEIKKVVSIPVTAVGNIRSPEVAERILQEGKADFINLGRALSADPEWPKKVKEGRVEDIIKCTSCLGCLRVLFALPVRCALNATTGREREYGVLKHAEKSKKVTIVGGGAAGMEAARVATLRGHNVTLYEKEPALGGQLRLNCVAPGKDKYNWFTDYLKTQMNKLKVNIKLSEEATADSIEKEKPDVVILATGAEPIVPDIPGIKSAKVVTAWDVLGKKVEVSGEKVVIAGGGMVGCETAEFLVQAGNDVTIVEMLDALATDMELVHMVAFLGRLATSNIKVRTGSTVGEITDKGVVITDKEGKKDTVQADRVVLALGSRSRRDLEEPLEGKVPELYVIGDSCRPGRIMDAVYDGSRIARMI